MTSMPGQDRPDSSYSGRMHPFRAASWSGESDGRYVSLRSLGPLSSKQWEKVHEESVPSNKGDGEENGREKYEEKEGKKADVTTWEIPMTMDRETTLWVPSPMAREPGVARDDSSEHSGAGLDKVDQARAHETAAPAASIDEDSDEEWVEIVSPHSTAASVRMVPAEPALVEARRPSLAVARGETRCPQAQSQTQFQPRILSQTKNEAHQEMSFPSIPLDPGPSIQQHAPKEAEPPQRNSSFVGLPLIRRGSTFGLTPKAARSAADHFSQNDEDGDHDVPFAPASVPSHPPGNSTAGNSVAPTMVEPISPNSLISRPEVTLPCQTTSARMSPDPEMVTSAPPEQPDPVTESEQDQAHPHSPGSPDHQQQQILSSNGAPPMIPPNMAGNPIQRLPPAGAGDWKLEESHLSEPLHSVSRNRAGTSNSQQHSSYGFEKDTGVTQQQPGSSFDKETGGSQRDQPQEPTYDEYDKDTGVTRPPLTLPTGPTPASLTSPVRHRHKPSSDVPPSTTNRYPELFRREDPRPRANPHTNSPPPGQQFQQFDQLPGHFFQSPSVPGPGTAPDAESTGGERSRRKSSGLFKEFSSRFAKPSERHGSIEPSVKQHPPAEHINGRSEPDFAIDEMHPNQRKGQNGSFLSSLRGRASMDLISQNQDGMPGPSHLQGPPQVHPDQTRPDTPQSQFERKHTRFASLGLPSGPFKHKSTALPGSSSSSIVNEPGAAMNPLPLPNMPPKRRFSGFSPRSGVFNRSSLDVPPKPGTPNSLRPSTGNQTLDSPEFMAPPPSIGDLARSNTDGPAPLVPPKMPAAGEVLGGPEPRKRRGSASGLISGFLGHVRNRSQSQGNAVSFPQGQSPPGQGPSPMQSPAVQGPPMHGPSNQLPPAQNPLGQHPPPRSPLAQPPLTQVSQGQFGLSHSSGQVSAGHHPGHRAVRPNPQVQIPSGQGPDGQPIPGLAPQLPPLGPMSPVQLQGQTPWTQLPSGQNSMASQPPARPPIRQQMTETSSLDSQFQSSTERPSTSGRHSTATSQGFEVTENNPSQASLHQAWSSSLRQESPVTAEEFPKVTNSPDSPLPSPRNVGSSLVDDASIGMQYGSRGVSPAPSVPLSHALHHTSSKSLDNVLQTNTDVAEVQRTSMHSANLSFQSDVRAGHVRRESHARDDLPTSPISQMSRTGPPSIASSQFNHSPALTSTAPTFNGRASQPGTPSLSAASNTPPMQTQGFGTHAAESVQQQALPSSSHLQQQLQQQVPTSSPFPHQQQPQPPRQTSSASFPQQPGMQPGNPSPVHQAHTLRAHTSIQTMSSPSSQVSMHFPHSSMQMQVLPGSQVPPKNTMPSPGPSPVQIDASPRQDGSASKWRGLKNRISSQTTSKSPHEQGRPEGEEKKTSKLFGAFKRGSKVPPPGQNIPAGFLPPGQGPRPQGTPQQGVPHSQYQMHMRQQMQPGRQIPSVQQPQPFIGQPPHPQGYPCQQPPQSHGPIGQQPSRSMLGVNQQIRQSPPTGQQPFHPRSPAVGLQPRPGPPSGYVIGQRLPGNRQPGQQMMNPRNAPQNFQGQVQLQQQRPPQGYTEPQYAQVPIPQGYTAVHGEGIAVPSSYYLNKNPGQSHVSQQHQQFIAQPVQYPSQPLHPQARSPVSATGPPMFQGQHLAQVQASLPQSQPQPQAPMSHPASPQATSPKDIAHVRNGLVTQATHSEGDEHSPVESRGGSVDTSSQHPQTQGVTANNSHSTGSGNSSPGGLNTNIVNAADRNTIEPKPKSTRMQENEDGSSKPQSSRGSTGAASPRSPINSGETLSRQQEPQMVTVENGPRRISLSPPTMADLNISRSHSQDLSTSAVSDEPITDTNVVQDGGKDSSEDVASNATDELEPGNPKESDEAVALGETDNGALARSKTRNHGAPAELEDTTNAHARKLRLATQEEKIHYDPNADSDGEPPPQMSATSYPGQEWNPYGMPEYGEWNE